ncbi:MAG TPA: TIR domain-containing protein [Pyrinomonadaceae bacterium]|nr:TIR domain-containing protein [Pyrinomonadaceae bacterium]
MNYKAFISYSHSADDTLAPALQSALHRFAKPFYRLRAIRVFRDKTSLHLTPELWPLIQRALADSEYFLLLCSPDAAKSHWVQNEVAEWLKLNGGADKLLLVLTEGEIVWNDAANDFDWDRTDALPANLRNVFKREPLYSDLRWARKATDVSLRNPQFLDEIGSLAATLHGRSKDEMIGNDVRQHRVFKTITAAAVLLLLSLTAAASSTAFYAVRQRDEARRQTAEADRQRRSAVEAADRERLAADRERKAAESERIARENEENQRKKAEQATKNETVAKNQAEERRREAERQRLLADQRREEAERERNIATSRELAASADSQLNSDPELSLLLSLKAHDRTPTIEAQDALRRSLLRSRVRATFKTLNWYETAYSPDGKWIVLFSSKAEVIEPRTWKVVTELKGPGRWNSPRSVDFSRDGKFVLTVSDNLDDKRSTLRLWEAGSWRVMTEFVVAEQSSLTRAQFSPDGKMAVTWSWGKNTPRVWNLATHDSVALGDRERFIEGAPSFTSDGKMVAIVERDESKKLARVWDPTTGKPLHQPDCEVSLTTYEVPISPDGKHLAVICADDTLRIIKTGSWENVAQLGGQTQRPRLATFSPDGEYLVTAGYDRLTRVWRTDTWKPVTELRGHSGRLEKMQFSNDGRVLVTASEDGTARVWESGTWRPLAILQGHTKPMTDLTVSPDSRYVVTAAKDSSARIWEIDLSGGDDVAEIDGSTENGLANALPMVYSPDGRLVAITSATQIVEIWEPSTSRRITELGRGTFLGFSPDGRYAFKVDNRRHATPPSFDAEMWDVRTWQKVADLPGHSEDIRDIAFSPDGRLVATAGGEVRIWETGTGKSVAVFKERSWRVVFSPDGKWLGTLNTQTTAHIREVGTWRDVAELRGHTAWIRTIAFSNDGSRILTAGEDRTARLWETGTWREVAVLEEHEGRIDEVSFSPDSRYLVTASWDKTARLWDAVTGKLVSVLEGHTGFVNSARFSPDGRLVATAADSTVRIWDGITGQSVIVIPVFTQGFDSSGSQRSVRSAIFSPDGKSLLVSGSDATTRIYSWEMFATLDDLLALGRMRVTRDFSVDERKKYLHEVVDEKQQPNR